MRIGRGWNVVELESRVIKVEVGLGINEGGLRFFVGNVGVKRYGRLKERGVKGKRVGGGGDVGGFV